MITREILEAQLVLYQNGQARAMQELEKSKADVAAFGGGIQACHDMLRLLTDLEEAKEAQGEPGQEDDSEAKAIKAGKAKDKPLRKD